MKKHILIYSLYSLLLAPTICLCQSLHMEVGDARNPTIGNSLESRFVEVKSGKFQMGSNLGKDDQKPAREVTISHRFWIGAHEITQKEWRLIMKTTVIQQRDLENPGFPIKGQGDNYPMYYVNWNEAVEFCRRLTEIERAAWRLPAGYVYRLPTEAEWEYAARGGHASNPTKFSGSDKLDDVSWHIGNSGGDARPVGQKRANELGIYDMTGNVWEFVHDRYQGNYQMLGTVDPRGPTRGMQYVTRGGSGVFVKSVLNLDYHVDLTVYNVTSRSMVPPDIRVPNLGFRVVLAPEFR